MGKKETYWRVVEIIDMVYWLDMEPWGSGGQDLIRLSKTPGAYQPEFCLSHEEIKRQFEEKFRLIPWRGRKDSNIFEVIPIAV